MAAPKIIVIGGGLAGLSAVIKIAEMGANVDLFSIVPRSVRTPYVRRAASTPRRI